MSLSDTALSLSSLSQLQQSLPIEFDVNFLKHVQRVDGFFNVLLFQGSILGILKPCSTASGLFNTLCRLCNSWLLYSLHKVNNPEAVEQGLRMPRIPLWRRNTLKKPSILWTCLRKLTSNSMGRDCCSRLSEERERAVSERDMPTQHQCISTSVRTVDRPTCLLAFYSCGNQHRTPPIFNIHWLTILTMQQLCGYCMTCTKKTVRRPKQDRRTPGSLLKEKCIKKSIQHCLKVLGNANIFSYEKWF